MPQSELRDEELATNPAHRPTNRWSLRHSCSSKTPRATTLALPHRYTNNLHRASTCRLGRPTAVEPPVLGRERVFRIGNRSGLVAGLGKVMSSVTPALRIRPRSKARFSTASRLRTSSGLHRIQLGTAHHAGEFSRLNGLVVPLATPTAPASVCVSFHFSPVQIHSFVVLALPPIARCLVFAALRPSSVTVASSLRPQVGSPRQDQESCRARGVAKREKEESTGLGRKGQHISPSICRG
jgi:hypothetical protein